MTAIGEIINNLNFKKICMSNSVSYFWRLVDQMHFVEIDFLPWAFLKVSSQVSLFYGAYLQHPKTFHPRAFILSFSSLHFILTNSSLHFHPLNFIFTNSSPTFYPAPCNPFQIIYYISYPTNSSSSKWDLLFHTFNLIHTISSSSIHSLNFISLI